MKLNIKTMNGSNLKVDWDEDDSVHEIKMRIKDTYGFDSSRQCLIFKGKVLENQRTLSQWNITSEDHLTLVILSVLLKEAYYGK